MRLPVPLSAAEKAREKARPVCVREVVCLLRLRSGCVTGSASTAATTGTAGSSWSAITSARARRFLVARRERRGDTAIAEPLEVAADRRGHLVLVALLFHPPG